MARPSNGSIALYIALAISFCIYLSAFVVSIYEYRYNRWIYDKMCHYKSCWPALYQVWAVGIASSVVSFVISIALIILNARKIRFSRIAMIVSAVLIAAMWLAVIVLGWVPLNITLEAGYNGLPEYSSSGNVWATDYKSYDSTPSAGMFHYALAWYRIATQEAPSNLSSSFSDVKDKGTAGMAGVVIYNMAFAWSVIMAVFSLFHARNARHSAQQEKVLAAKERSGSA
ncbi:hypothetical protein GQ53DRAFT_812377 [Thozetella sp. PMI_491]|nr:hypothetical protein GQ53DRAFT_812377 [Thozetella sp. PMI_491]